MTTAQVRLSPARRAQGVLHLDVDVAELLRPPRAAAELLAARERALQTWEDEHVRGLLITHDDPEAQRALEKEALRVALQEADEPADPMPPTVVIAHRTDWFRSLVATDLLERGVAVVASTSRRDEALGALVVHQPDVVVLSDHLVGASGLSLAQRARTLCPGALVVAQVEADGNLRAAREMGAHAVLSRSSRVQDLVDVVTVLAPPGAAPLPQPRPAHGA